MGECLIARGLSMDPEKVVKYGYVIKTEIITENTIWEVPGNAAVEKGVAVRIFGGGAGKGGSMGTHCGGGGGYMNNAILNLRKYEKIIINIGAGGSGAGGTTVFGSYLSANGGVTTGDLCDSSTLKQANGGIGGSGGGGGWWSNGGIGVQFGGGGGGGFQTYSPPANNLVYGGNGGIWGGGGGGITGGGRSRQYGGNGGTIIKSAENGTNIFNIYDSNTLENDLTVVVYSATSGSTLGGGGGYGGCGGTIYATIYNNIEGYTCISGGGGGGGFGANGGNASIIGNKFSCGGGGGGYGGKGADGNFDCGGGGGGYGPSNYGAGGGGTAINKNNGKQGVCIIQYYVKDLV